MRRRRIALFAVVILAASPCLAQTTEHDDLWFLGPPGPPGTPSAEGGPITGLPVPVLGHVTWSPGVLDWQATGTATLTVELVFWRRGGFPTRVILHYPEGDHIVLPQITGTETFRAVVPVERILAGYHPGQFHKQAGKLELLDLADTITFKNVFVNVRDPLMPDVPITQLSEDVQASPHVVNIRHDEPWLGPYSVFPTPLSPFFRFYEFFPDDYDFIALVGNGTAFSGSSFFAFISNQVEGIGLPILDLSSQVGSAGRLQGFLGYSLPEVFDLGSGTAVHELGHRWGNFMDEVPLLGIAGCCHWPISSLAYGVLGWSTGTGGLAFPYRLEELDNGDYEVVKIRRADHYNDFELYLMGLIPPEDVADGIVLLNQNQRHLVHDGGILQGPAGTVSVQDIIDAVGPRNPPAGQSQTVFRIATIVLSRGRLLTPEEMAYFDHMAARGEDRASLRFVSGLAEGITKPFFQATGGRATLSTRLN